MWASSLWHRMTSERDRTQARIERLLTRLRYVGQRLALVTPPTEGRLQPARTRDYHLARVTGERGWDPDAGKSSRRHTCSHGLVALPR
jgi:hypothetical protein